MDRNDQPQPPPTPAPCTGCGGQGGRVIDTSSDGVIRQHWKSCGACGGTGKTS